MNVVFYSYNNLTQIIGIDAVIKVIYKNFFAFSNFSRLMLLVYFNMWISFDCLKYLCTNPVLSIMKLVDAFLNYVLNGWTWRKNVEK